MNILGKGEGFCYTFRPFVLLRLTNFKTPVCSEDKEYPKERSGHRIVCNESDLFIFGGYNPAGIWTEFQRHHNQFLFKEIWKYNFFSKRWMLILDQEEVGMPEELASCAITGEGATLIIFGGTGFPFGESCSNSCYVINTNLSKPTINKLSVEGQIPMPQYGQAITMFGNCMYTVGGTSGLEYYCDIHRLNTLTRFWECVYASSSRSANDPEGRYKHGLVRCDHLLYILGGGTSNTVFDLEMIPAFNLQTLKWSYRQTQPDGSIGFPAARRCHSCIQCGTGNDTEAVIAGGCGDNVFFSDIWKLSFKTFKWKLLQTCKLPSPLYFHDAAISRGACMYIFGGIEVNDPPKRTNNMYKIWVTIPKLSEICWEAISYYCPSISKLSKLDLLSVGIPQRFIDRLSLI